MTHRSRSRVFRTGLVSARRLFPAFREQCRRGDFAMCLNRKVTGVDFDGGYADYIIASGGAACDRRRRRRCPQASRSRAAAASRGARANRSSLC